MKTDILSQYVNVRDALYQEKSDLEKRLAEIKQALGEASTAVAAAPSAVKAAGRRGGRGGNALSLRDAVLQATAAGPLSRRGILAAVKKLGYRFKSSNPLNSLGAVLYGKKPKFINNDGLFSPVGGGGVAVSAVSAPAAIVSAAPRKRRKRHVSPEARAKLAAAAKARWARVKAAGRSTL